MAEQLNLLDFSGEYVSQDREDEQTVYTKFGKGQFPLITRNEVYRYAPHNTARENLYMHTSLDASIEAGKPFAGSFVFPRCNITGDQPEGGIAFQISFWGSGMKCTNFYYNPNGMGVSTSIVATPTVEDGTIEPICASDGAIIGFVFSGKALEDVIRINIEVAFISVYTGLSHTATLTSEFASYDDFVLNIEDLPVITEPIDHASFLQGYIVGRRLAAMRGNLVIPDEPIAPEPVLPDSMAAGLYETGTANIIYTWEQLLGNDAFDGGAVHLVDGNVSTNYDTANSKNASSDVLAGDLVLPDDTTSLASRAFSHCINLTKVHLPAGIVTIGARGFYMCKALKTVVIPDGVAKLDTAVFRFCTGLTSIVIPASVTAIAGYALDGCTALESITFQGTIEQWKSISFDSTWKGSVPATTVVCLDGTVALV